MPIIKSEGVTRTERLLAQFCDRSFLRLWSYPNPFKKDRAELCDLLAVFENHVFIFLIGKIFSLGIWTPTPKWPGTDGSARQLTRSWALSHQLGSARRGVWKTR